MRLVLIVPVSILRIFVLLFSALGSLNSEFFSLSNVPSALTGGIVALLVLHVSLGVAAAIGFITLFEQAALSGVVMVCYFDQLWDEGMDAFNSVLSGAPVQLRTVLITAPLEMLELQPRALSHGIGSELQKPLAIVIIGELISATLLTLIALPALYLLHI